MYRRDDLLDRHPAMAGTDLLTKLFNVFDRFLSSLSKMLLNRKGDRALEAGGREDVARMARVGEPLHDRAQALRHTGGRVSDAVVVHEEKPHI